MRLLIATPMEIVADCSDVLSLVAEDETGSFGIQPGHADFLTVLSICVATWRDKTEKPHYAAVRHGVLSVADGKLVRILTREAVTGPNLQELQTNVLARFRETARLDTSEHARAAALHAAALKQVWNFLTPNQTAEAPIV